MLIFQALSVCLFWLSVWTEIGTVGANIPNIVCEFCLVVCLDRDWKLLVLIFQTLSVCLFWLSVWTEIGNCWCWYSRHCLRVLSGCLSGQRLETVGANIPDIVCVFCLVVCLDRDWKLFMLIFQTLSACFACVSQMSGHGNCRPRYSCKKQAVSLDRCGGT